MLSFAAAENRRRFVGHCRRSASAGGCRTLCALTPGSSRRPCSWSRCSPLVRLAGRSAQEPAAATAAPSASRRPTAARATAGRARTRAAAADSPGINFVRVDVIVTDGKGKPVLDLKPEEFVGLRGRQAAEDRAVLGRQDRRGRADRERPTTAIRTRLRRGARGGAARSPAVRDAARRLSRAPRQRHGGAQAADRLHPEPARAGRHGGDHVSADAGRRHPLLAQPQRADRARSRSSRGASSTTSRGTRSRSSTPTTRRRPSSGSATR